MKLEEELVKAKARLKVTKAQEELENGITIESGLKSGHQFGFTGSLGYRERTANNMQSISQNLNFLQLFNTNSTRVKTSDRSETFGKVSSSHSAAVHNLHKPGG